jgi:hypothetical protein
MITDCHHDDLTAIINARVQARHDRKAANQLRYERKHRWTQPQYQLRRRTFAVTYQ